MSAKIYPDIMSESRYLNTPASICVMGNSVDADIVPFLKQLNSYPWLVTTSCCSGHDPKEPYPYVGVAVKAEAMRRFTGLLNRLDEFLENNDGSLDCNFTFQKSCAVSCWFEQFPDWLMFDLQITTAEQDYGIEFWLKLSEAVKVRRAKAAIS